MGNETADSERPVIYCTNVTLDGFASGPNGELDWGLPDEEYHRFINNQLMSKIDTFLFGRRMYEVMTFWDDGENYQTGTEAEHEFARLWNTQLKVVFSSMLTSVQGNARLADGDLAHEIAHLRGQPGDAIAVGGATLASHAVAQQLVDEVQLFIHPVVIGSGTAWLQGVQNQLKFKLLETHPFKSGVVFLRYQVL